MNKVGEILDKAVALAGLTAEEAGLLLKCNDIDTQMRVFETAKKVKEQIYGKRIVLFAPLYITNDCINSCLYCGFHKDNQTKSRKTLELSELSYEVKCLIDNGVKRILLVASENPAFEINRLIEAIETCYSVHTEKGEIRRVNVNVAPMTINDFKKLHSAKIGTYQVFQETYDRNVYKTMHPKGPKSNYDFRYQAPFMAIEAGIGDIGMGVLFGLHDPITEIKALLNHIAEMEKIYGIGPHTISVPRIKPAEGASLSYNPPFHINDDFFAYIVAILRIAVPYTGVILSTRETAALRDKLFHYGVSQISAASKTTPGGYGATKDTVIAQFSTSDERSLEEIVLSLCKSGFIPSFCTACYRKGRIGEEFMELAKGATIKNFCNVNALLSLAEYAANFTTDVQFNALQSYIDGLVSEITNNENIKSLIKRVYEGERDIYL